VVNEFVGGEQNLVKFLGHVFLEFVHDFRKYIFKNSNIT
jgi:hypothetical protein